MWLPRPFLAVATVGADPSTPAGDDPSTRFARSGSALARDDSGQALHSVCPRRAGGSTCQRRPRWSQSLPMADELDGMTTFVAVAETRGFRAAGERLGVSHSAVSQALRRLEERLRNGLGAAP